MALDRELVGGVARARLAANKGVAAAKMALPVGVAMKQPGLRGLGAHREPGLLRERFKLVEMSHQFVFGSPAGEVELNHLQGANGWVPTHPKTDKEAGDDGQGDLNRNAALAFGQQMTATEASLEPAEN